MSRGSCGNSPSEEEAGMLRPGSLSRLEGRALRWGAEGGGYGQRPWGRKQLGESHEQRKGQWEQILFEVQHWCCLEQREGPWGSRPASLTQPVSLSAGRPLELCSSSISVGHFHPPHRHLHLQATGAARGWCSCANSSSSDRGAPCSLPLSTPTPGRFHL